MGSWLLVSTRWAILRPRYVERVTGKSPRFFCILGEVERNLNVSTIWRRSVCVKNYVKPNNVITMKKLVLLSFALLSLGVNAQEGAESQALPSKQATESPYKPYSQLYVGYSPIFMSEGGYHKAGTKTYHGGIIGWAYGLPLTKKCPLYLEFGFTLSFNGKKESWEIPYINEDGVLAKAVESSSKYSLLRLGVPFNVSYRISVGNKLISFPCNRSVETNIQFIAIPMKDNDLAYMKKIDS